MSCANCSISNPSTAVSQRLVGYFKSALAPISESEEAALYHVRAETASKTSEVNIQHWVKVSDCLKYCKVDWYFYPSLILCTVTCRADQLWWKMETLYSNSIGPKERSCGVVRVSQGAIGIQNLGRVQVDQKCWLEMSAFWGIRLAQ